jgi:hypothetical protein
MEIRWNVLVVPPIYKTIALRLPIQFFILPKRALQLWCADFGRRLRNHEAAQFPMKGVLSTIW